MPADLQDTGEFWLHHAQPLVLNAGIIKYRLTVPGYLERGITNGVNQPFT